MRMRGASWRWALRSGGTGGWLRHGEGRSCAMRMRGARVGAGRYGVVEAAGWVAVRGGLRDADAGARVDAEWALLSGGLAAGWVTVRGALADADGRARVGLGRYGVAEQAAGCVTVRGGLARCGCEARVGAGWALRSGGGSSGLGHSEGYVGGRRLPGGPGGYGVADEAAGCVTVSTRSTGTPVSTCVSPPGQRISMRSAFVSFPMPKCAVRSLEEP